MSEELLDRKSKEKRFLPGWAVFFWLASLALIMRFLFTFLNWPYADYWLILSGALYEIYSLLRLFLIPKKTPFQTYSYLFFIFVIPGFILDYFNFEPSRYFLYIALVFPLLFFGQLGLKIIKRNNKQ